MYARVRCRHIFLKNCELLDELAWQLDLSGSQSSSDSLITLPSSGSLSMCMNRELWRTSDLRRASSCGVWAGQRNAAQHARLLSGSFRSNGKRSSVPLA